MVTMTWSLLRVLGNAPLMRITVIAPFLPYLLSLIDYFLFAQAPATASFPSTDWAAKASISLHLFYFGGTLLGVASGIYMLCCPGYIKIYKDGIEFADREADKSSKDSIQSAHLKLRTRYTEMDLSRPIARRVVAALYLVGFLLVLAPPTYRFIETTTKFAAKLLTLPVS